MITASNFHSDVVTLNKELIENNFLYVNSAPSEMCYELAHNGNPLLALREAVLAIKPDVLLVQLTTHKEIVLDEEFDINSIFDDYKVYVKKFIELYPEKESALNKLKALNKKQANDVGFVAVYIAKNGLNLKLIVQEDWFEAYTSLLVFLSEYIDE